MRQCKNNMREAQGMKQNSMKQICFSRGMVNKNACGESTYNIEGLAFASQSFLSIPPHRLSNSFCSDPHKNCVVHAQPHKKKVDNGLIHARINALRSFKGRVAL